LLAGAIDATKDLHFPEKNPPLREIILTQGVRDVRTAAIRAVAIDGESESALITLLNRASERHCAAPAAVEQCCRFPRPYLPRAQLSRLPFRQLNSISHS